MTGPRAARLVGGLLALSVGLAVTATILAVLDDEGPPAFSWLMLTFGGVGAVVAVRRPSNPVGWLLLAEGPAWQASELPGQWHRLASSRPELPGAAVAAWLYELAWVVPVAGLALLFLLLPNGRLVSARWRWVVVALAVATLMLWFGLGLRDGPLDSPPGLANPFGVPALGAVPDFLVAAGDALLAMCVVAGLASFVVRYRRADTTTRQQLRWLALAAVVVLGAWIVASLVQVAGSPDAAGNIRVISTLLLPVACGVAVLKYRLYDIDLVVNKLVVYTGLAAFIAALYVAVVVGVGALIGSAGEPDVALTVAATAVAALTFDPARRGLQRLAGRAVYGRRASPYEALASMTRRVSGGFLAADVLEQMARSVAEATGGRGEVWVAHDGRLDRWACWPAPTREGTESVPVTDPVVVDGRDAAYRVSHGGAVLGALTVTKPSGEAMRPAEKRLLGDLAASAALVLENVRLVGELRASRQRLVAAQEQERRRVERDLHDGAQQRLLELSLTLGRVRCQIAAADAGKAASTLADARDQLNQALAELRDLARGIYPAILTEQGLEAAVESMAGRAPLPVDLDLAVGRRLDPVVESTSYFLTAEAIANVVKHAGDARVRIAIHLGQGGLTVEVVDDGTGGADPAGSGLRGLADRVAALNGAFEIASEPGQGTRIRAVLPCG